MRKRLRLVVGLSLALAAVTVGLGGVSRAGYQDVPGTRWVAGSTLRGVSFPDGVSGWAVGNGGLIIHSSDGGLTWEPQVSGTKVTLHDVQFVDDARGWAVGDDGVIVTSDDGGSTWIGQSSAADEHLYALTFVNTSTGWAVGDAGTVLTTEDGGAHWQSQTSNTVSPLYGVDFVDSRHGWAVGADGTVIATVDGGLTWYDQPSCDEIHDLYAVDFVNEDEGWVAGWGGALWKTSDGGDNWGEWLLGWSRTLYALALTDADHGWALGGGGFVARLDFPSWTEQESGLDADVDLRDLDFVGQRGWAVGSGGTVLSTSNGGGTWVREVGSTIKIITGMDFIDQSHGWAAAGAAVAGYPGELLYTSDGGATWSVRKSDVPYLNDVQFITQDRGWVAGGRVGNGVVLATTDGGGTWVAQDSPVSGPMLGVHFVSPDDGWAVGGALNGNGWILNTRDGGHGWALQKYINGSGCLYDVCFGDSTHGWAVGLDGSIWATVNGSDWFAQTSGVTSTLHSLACYDQLVWVVGGGFILTTRDGGSNWSVHETGYPSAALLDVDFNGPGWGWVVGVDNSNRESLMLATGDQGMTWLRKDLPVDAGLLRSVHAFRHGEAPMIWTGGANGIVLSSRLDGTVPVSCTVTVAGGGRLFSRDGSASLLFPAGAVTETTTITYTPRMAAEVPSTGDLTGVRVFELTGVSNTSETSVGIAPGARYTVTVDYSGAVVAEDAQLGLYHWSGSAWVKESTSDADWDRDLVTANPNHFSLFGVLGTRYAVYLPVLLRN